MFSLCFSSGTQSAARSEEHCAKAEAVAMERIDVDYDWHIYVRNCALEHTGIYIVSEATVHRDS